MTEETTPTPAPSPVRDRFDMEQFILDCWKVTDDIKMYSERDVTNEDWQALANYYEHKFDRLWDLFESMIRSGNIR
jgi:hypothetical protein